ncbi:hypothetical protein MA16_Dca029100 [Dendrobium catenatum]|uniref:Uncharacterized protein n=1 Tax=Dendrobium catenatum TaxID=906689 RepID=A0A2I0V9U6_9ASPA|nr:hypothetical protein MA16_Dca029100 [Dendrobium catenatum]
MGQSLSSCCFDDSGLFNMELGDGAHPCKLKPKMLEKTLKVEQGKPVKAEEDKPVAMMVPNFPVISLPTVL